MACNEKRKTNNEIFDQEISQIYELFDHNKFDKSFYWSKIED